MAKNSRKLAVEDWAEGLMFSSVVLGRASTLYRNQANALFPERLSGEELVLMRDRLCEAILKAPGVLGKQAFALKSDDAEFVFVTALPP